DRLTRPLLGVAEGGVTSRGGAEWLVLSTSVPLVVHGSRAVGRTTLHAGQTVLFGLHRSTLEETPARLWKPDELQDRLDRTVEAWRSWSDLHQQYDGPGADLVH